MGKRPLRLLHGRTDAAAAGSRRSLSRPDEPKLAGLSFLVVILFAPLLRSLVLPFGRAAVSCVGLAVVAALFIISQRLTPRHPLPLRVALFACLTAISVAGVAEITSAWVAAAALAAVASANLLPLLRAAAGGVVVVTGLNALASDSALAVLPVAAGGVIALLRGRLMVEIAQSRANRQAHAMAAVENERLRIARDLHDLLGNSLVTMVVQAELAERLAGRDPEASALAARDVQQVGRAAMLQVQQAVSGYRATSLADEVEQAQQTLRPLRNGVTVSMTSRTWSPETDSVLAWGLREGVTNILRHANASNCVIEVTADTRMVRLTLTNDDLSGGEIEADAPGGGHGLAGLRERASELGGDLTAAHLPGGGFRLALELPLDGVSADRATPGGRP